MRHNVYPQYRYHIVTSDGKTMFIDSLSKHQNDLFIGKGGLAKKGIVHLNYFDIPTAGRLLAPVIAVSKDMTRHILFVANEEFHASSFAQTMDYCGIPSECFEAYSVLPDITQLKGQMPYINDGKSYIIEACGELKTIDYGLVYFVHHIDGGKIMTRQITLFNLLTAMSGAKKGQFHSYIFDNNNQ